MVAKPAAFSPLPTVGVFLLFHLLYLVLPMACVCVPVFLIICTDHGAIGVSWITAYLTWVVFSHHSEVDGKGRPWEAYENFAIWGRIFEWFPLRLVPPAVPLSPSNQYIFVVHPHGGLASNRAMFGFCTKHFWDPAFPGVDFRVLTATAAFRIPIIREAWLWSYCIDASKKSAVRALQNGTSLLLYPGGVKEQLMTERGRHRVFLKSRKGFVKLALQHGCSLVPIYVFGETDLYDHWRFGIGFRRWVADRFNASIVLLSGSWGLLPYRVQVTGVSGAPIRVAGIIEHPSQEQIDALHDKYMRALQKLFDSEKKKYGYDNAVLEIL